MTQHDLVNRNQKRKVRQMKKTKVTKKTAKVNTTKRLVTKANHPYTLGQAYLIRTVTHYYTGRLIAVFEHEMVLEDAAWVADTGRYHDALRDGTLKEVEPIMGLVIIGRGAIVDCVWWSNSLPREQQ